MWGIFLRNWLIYSLGEFLSQRRAIQGARYLTGFTGHTTFKINEDRLHYFPLQGFSQNMEKCFFLTSLRPSSLFGSISFLLLVMLTSGRYMRSSVALLRAKN